MVINPVPVVCVIQLTMPVCAVRFKLHGTLQHLANKSLSLTIPILSLEPVYRVAEQEWKDFVEAFADVLVQVDNEVPPLPPKDLIHRIYRDVRPLLKCLF